MGSDKLYGKPTVSGGVVRVLILMCLGFVLSGCDFVYGVDRGAALDAMPSPACVEKVIGETPGIAKVDKRQEEGGRPLTLAGIHDPDQDYYFIYQGAEGSHIWGALMISRRYDGTVTLNQDNVRLNEKPPQEDIDASREAMRKIEIGLEQHCAISPTPLPIHEHGTGVQCEPLASLVNATSRD